MEYSLWCCGHYLCNDTLCISIDIPLLWALNVCLINHNQHICVGLVWLVWHYEEVRSSCSEQKKRIEVHCESATHSWWPRIQYQLPREHRNSTEYASNNKGNGGYANHIEKCLTWKRVFTSALANNVWVYIWLLCLQCFL